MPFGAAPFISIVVPVLDDGEAAASLLAQLVPDRRAEIVLALAGSDSRLVELAGSRGDVRIVGTPTGRARQMNAGAAVAAGEWLWFVHADSRLPDGWQRCFEELPDAVVGGWFRFALDEPSWRARLIEAGTRWRVRTFALPYGDQGLFVRRALFAALGGYADLPLMEDVDFVRRLRRAGPVHEVPAPLATSARRWRRHGWVAVTLQHLALITLYLAGVPPRHLARWRR